MILPICIDGYMDIFKHIIVLVGKDNGHMNFVIYIWHFPLKVVNIILCLVQDSSKYEMVSAHNNRDISLFVLLSLSSSFLFFFLFVFSMGREVIICPDSLVNSQILLSAHSHHLSPCWGLKVFRPQITLCFFQRW